MTFERSFAAELRRPKFWLNTAAWFVVVWALLVLWLSL